MIKTKTERLILRAFESSDVNWYFEMVSREEFKKRLPGLWTENIENGYKYWLDRASCVPWLYRAEQIDFEQQAVYRRRKCFWELYLTDNAGDSCICDQAV